MQNATILKTAAALTTAAAIAASAMMPTAAAAPVASRAAQLEQATAGQVIDVQGWRWRRAAPWIAGGIVAGAIIAGSQRRYYDEEYYYEDAPPSAYAVPRGPGPRMCWIETGPNGATGYWAAC
jgi:hypothetical protein